MEKNEQIQGVFWKSWPWLLMDLKESKERNLVKMTFYNFSLNKWAHGGPTS